jgi:hypothetical protein
MERVLLRESLSCGNKRHERIPLLRETTVFEILYTLLFCNGSSYCTALHYLSFDCRDLLPYYRTGQYDPHVRVSTDEVAKGSTAPVTTGRYSNV